MGDIQLSRSELQARYALPSGSAQTADTAGGKDIWEEAARDWAIKEILLQEAHKRGLEQDSLFLGRLKSLSEELLIKSLYEHASSAVQADSEEVQQEYNLHRQEYVSAADQVDLVYVVAPTRELANQARRAFQAGSELADVLALDPSLTGAQAGWVRQEDLNPAIAKAAFGLLPGDISYPQKREEDGYVILFCRQRRTRGTMLPLAEVYDEIHGRVLQRKTLEAEKELRDSLWAVYRPEINVGTARR